MKKLLAYALTFLLPAAVAQAEPLRVGIDLTYPPYDYLDASNQPAGFDVELVNLIGAKSGREIFFLDTRFENLILGVSSDKFDVIASALYVTRDRAKQIDYVPYMKTGVSIVVAANSGQSFKTPEELCGKRVSSIKGAAWVRELEKLNKAACAGNPIDIREFPSSPEATQALISGGSDAQLDNSAVLTAAVAKLRGRIKISSTQQLYPAIVGFGIKKENKELTAFLSKTLKELENSKDYKALYARYGVTGATEAEFRTAIAD